MEIKFKQWCAGTKYESTEVMIKSDNMTFSEENLSNDDLLTLGRQFIYEGLRNKGWGEVVEELIKIGIINEEQIGEWYDGFYK